MPDDKPMATLESIAAQLSTVVAKVDALAARADTVDARFDGMDARLDAMDARFGAMDGRFDGMDARFDGMDARFEALDAKIDTSAAETRAQLSVQIEAVREDVKRVYDTVIAQRQNNTANRRAHAGFNKRLDDHDLRILALEHPKRPQR